MRRFLLILAGLAAALTVSAQDRQADSLRHSFGRQKLSSSNRKSTPYADTLDTGNPAVKVVLYNNGTYRYVKDPAKVVEDSVFTANWDTKAVNPYREEPEDIPDPLLNLDCRHPGFILLPLPDTPQIPLRVPSRPPSPGHRPALSYGHSRSGRL